MRRFLTLFAFAGLFAFQALPVHAVDGDGDKVDDSVDVCPTVADPFQGDIDGDGVGDLCEDAAGVSSFEGTAASELIIGTSGDDTLSGAGGNDALYGLEGDDTLNGGSGNDFLSGGPGADTLTGGSGCDLFAFAPVGEQDFITDFNPASDRLTFPAPGEDEPADPLAEATFGGEEHLVVIFGEGDDAATLEFEGLPAGEQIVLSTGPCSTPPEEIPEEPEEPEEPFVCEPMFPDEVEDIFDEFLPLDGEQVYGTDEDDTLEGTDCSDIIVGDATLDLEFEDLEDILEDIFDQTCPEDAAPIVAGSFSAPIGVTSTCGDDLIYGLAGNDLIIGDKLLLTGLEIGGNDTIHGGVGNDIIMGDAAIILQAECGCIPLIVAGDLAAGPVGGDDTIYGDEGTDLIFGDSAVGLLGPSYGGDDSLYGGDDDDYLVGEGFIILGGGVAGDDYLEGGDGNDYLYGDAVLGIDGDSSAGEDTLVGGAGDDFLVGDGEFVDGNADSDTFVYDTTTDFGNDTIADLGTREVIDTIQFDGISFSDLEDRTLWADDATDLIATLYTDNSHGTATGSIRMNGPGGSAISSWTALMAAWPVDVFANP